MKNTLILTLTGALLGVVVASYVVPPAVSWYAEPAGLPGAGQIQAIVQIPEVIRYATTKLIQGQLIAGIIGGVAGLGLGVYLGLRRRKTATATRAAAAPGIDVKR